MTFALWAILAAALLPILTTGIAKWGVAGYDNSNPRDWSERHTGWRRRADAAHRNHFEAFPPFAAAVLVATVTHAAQGTADLLAAGFLAFRLGYTAAYVFDKPTVRSVLWAGAVACVIGLFVIS